MELKKSYFLKNFASFLIIMIKCQYIFWLIVFDILIIITVARGIWKKMKNGCSQIQQYCKVISYMVKFEHQGNKKNKIKYWNFLDIKSVCEKGMILIEQKYHFQ